MAAQRPSQLLGSLASTYDPNIYEIIVEQHVIPFLDCLPTKEKTALMTILTKAQDDYLGSGLVAFETYTASIASEMEEVESHIRMDRREGEMMGVISGKINEWLSILWTVGVEKGREHKLVHKSLKFCKTTIESLRDCDSLTEFAELDSGPEAIKDSKGAIVYDVEYGSSSEAISWVCSTQTLAKTLVADVTRFGVADGILKRLDTELAPTHEEITSGGDSTNSLKRERDWEKQERRDLLMNRHWTPEMRSAVPQVQALFASAGVVKSRPRA